MRLGTSPKFAYSLGGRDGGLTQLVLEKFWDQVDWAALNCRVFSPYVYADEVM